MNEWETNKVNTHLSKAVERLNENDCSRFVTNVILDDKNYHVTVERRKVKKV